ncbi:hypothetical protein GDO81_021846 [Engystomops pustulosus]|uniref:Secreted protein n=1 Tax=Engystomops pustulosus TaxID=76066 RepID=A0AAV6YS11_ENGPU|nr:hypothetical protein GDO81_021846 [Engystomops pustulosus]
MINMVTSQMCHPSGVQRIMAAILVLLWLSLKTFNFWWLCLCPRAYCLPPFPLLLKENPSQACRSDNFALVVTFFCHQEATVAFP